MCVPDWGLPRGCVLHSSRVQDHPDAWVNKGRKKPLEMGNSGGNFRLRNARVISQPGDGRCMLVRDKCLPCAFVCHAGLHRDNGALSQLKSGAVLTLTWASQITSCGCKSCLLSGKGLARAYGGGRRAIPPTVKVQGGGGAFMGSKLRVGNFVF